MAICNDLQNSTEDSSADQIVTDTQRRYDEVSKVAQVGQRHQHLILSLLDFKGVDFEGRNNLNFQELLDRLGNGVEVHEEFDSLCQDFSDWMKVLHQKLADCKDVTGDKQAVQARHASYKVRAWLYFLRIFVP